MAVELPHGFIVLYMVTLSFDSLYDIIGITWLFIYKFGDKFGDTFEDTFEDIFGDTFGIFGNKFEDTFEYTVKG